MTESTRTKRSKASSGSPHPTISTAAVVMRINDFIIAPELQLDEDWVLVLDGDPDPGDEWPVYSSD